jgi:hypothetical protein
VFAEGKYVKNLIATVRCTPAVALRTVMASQRGEEWHELGDDTMRLRYKARIALWNIQPRNVVV